MVAYATNGTPANGNHAAVNTTAAIRTGSALTLQHTKNSNAQTANIITSGRAVRKVSVLTAPDSTNVRQTSLVSGYRSNRLRFEASQIRKAPAESRVAI